MMTRPLAAWFTVAAFVLAPFLACKGAAPAFEGTPFGPAVAESRSTRADDRTRGNRLVMLSQGYDALLLRVHLIRNARAAIDIQTFIWTNDEVGRLMIYELIEAARRGVKVRIIADHLFSDQDPEIVAFLATVHPNFEVKHYRPATTRIRPSLLRTMLAGVQSFRSLNQRMHSKVMVIDDAILITGGRNIENTYFDHSVTYNFRDRDVLVIGPAVRSAVEEFDQFWKYHFSVPSRKMHDVAEVLKKDRFRRYNTRADYDFGPHFDALDKDANDPALITERFVAHLKHVGKALFIYDAPGKSRKGSSHSAQITRELRAVLEKARSSVLIQTPYLVLSGPGRDLVREMKSRNPNLQIRISTNSFASTDNLFAYSANYRLRNDYVQNLGLDIYEMKSLPGSLLTIFPRYPVMQAVAAKMRVSGSDKPAPFISLHAKSLVVDDAVAFVGSYNLDPRSEALNTEVGLLVEDAAFARALREEIERDMQPENSWVIARRQFPLGLDNVNRLVDGVLSLTPIDVWPIQNTSSFELKPGSSPLEPSAPSFYQNYRDAGSFPGTDGLLSQKEILARLFKAVGAPLTPML